MTRLVLDRIEIEEAGPNSARLAEAIHGQLGPRPGRVEVHKIARALDIIEIREEPLDGFEAALLTLPERGFGSILVNLKSSPQRRRYSVGHELLHFLNPWHEAYSPTGFECTRQDMIETNKRALDLHRRQEAEANEFAIELLAPSARVRSFVERIADLKHALSMARELDISREAAVRRYVALHEEALAAVFIAGGKVRYAEAGPDFPRLRISQGQPATWLSASDAANGLTEMEEADAADWLSKPDGVSLSAQTLFQQSGYATVLLKVDADSKEPEDIGVEDVYDRFARSTRSS